MSKIRVAIAGLGSCASALIQGVEYYMNQKEGNIPGLMHVDFGGYFIEDIEFVAGFDVNSKKISKDISEAIFTEPNLCARYAKVPATGVKVRARHDPLYPSPPFVHKRSHFKGPFLNKPRGHILERRSTIYFSS